MSASVTIDGTSFFSRPPHGLLLLLGAIVQFSNANTPDFQMCGRR